MSTDGSAVAERPTALNHAPSSLAVMKRQLCAEAGLAFVETSHAAERLMPETAHSDDT